METIYRSILKSSNWMLAGLLSLLGLSIGSCNPVDEYGTPYAEYQIKGKVTDTNGKAIEGIGISYKAVDESIIDTKCYAQLTTQEDGSYTLSFTSFPCDSIRIKAQDIDGAENGSFEADSIDVKTNALKGKDSWFWGSTEMNISDIKLKEKKE